MKLPVKIPGYDKWRLAGPPEWEGPTCDYCGQQADDARVHCEGFFYQGKNRPATLVCEECFTGTDDGPCFDDLQPASEYYRDQADLRADYLMDQARGRETEDSQP